MLWHAICAGRDLGRLHDIGSVLIRYGFGDVVRRIGMAGALERAGQALRWRAPEELARLEPPARVRRALEELGPTFIKLGQILATRVDLFPPEWISEFSRLQDAAPAAPFAELRAQLTEDLGRAAGGGLSASGIRSAGRGVAGPGPSCLARGRNGGHSQGAAARYPADRRGRRAPPLPSGGDRRSGGARSSLLSAAGGGPPVRPVAATRAGFLSAECRSAERIAANFAAHTEIVVPRIHWQWTSERLNVQDYVEGIPGRDLAAWKADGLDRKMLARRGADAVLKMILEDGFFHADAASRQRLLPAGQPHRLHRFRHGGSPVRGASLSAGGAAARARQPRCGDGGRGVAGLERWRRCRRRDPEGRDRRFRRPVSRRAASGELDLGAMLSDLVAILREHRPRPAARPGAA